MSSGAGRLARLVDAITSWLARVLHAGLSYLWLLVLAPVFAGSVGWFLVDPDARLKLYDTNKLSHEQQLAAVLPVVGAVGGVAVVLLVAYLALRLRRGLTFPRVAAGLSALLTPLLALPFAVALLQKGIEKESPVLTLFFCALVAAIVGVSTYRLSLRPSTKELGDERPWVRRLGDVAAWGAVLAMWVGYGWFFSKLSITNHHAMVTRSIDLGIYDNIFYQSAHGNPLGCTFIKGEYHGSAHFDPILVLLSPIYLLYPRAELILVLQSVWLGSGVVPVYLIAKDKLGSRFESVLLAACYALHPALHGANMYEFHSLTLATVPMLWALYTLFAGHRRLYWLALAAALLVREDIPLMMSMVGVVCLLHSDARMRRTGLVTLAVCVAYFAIVKAFFMTSAGILMSGKESYSFAYYYAELIPNGKGVGGMLLSLVTNPTFAVRHAFEREKLIFLTVVMLPLAFLPLAARGYRLLLLYGLAFTTLASREAVFSTHFQYTASLLPFVYFMAPAGIVSLRDGRLASAYALDSLRLTRGLVAAVFVASLAVSFKFGGVLPNETFRGGFSRVVRKLDAQQEEHYAWMQETVRLIPKSASVGVSNKIGPHVSNRSKVYFYGQSNTEYVFVDEKELKQDRLKRHQKAVKDGRLEQLARRGSYALFRVVPPKNAAGGSTAPSPSEGQEPKEEVKDVLGDDPRE